MQVVVRIFILFALFSFSVTSFARLEICNQTDLVLMVAVGYDTNEERTASEGWWRIYPGYCEVPVDVAMLDGSYYVHAESNPRSTMPGDAFTWGEERSLCVKLADFRTPNASECDAGGVMIKFNQVDKNWRNSNKVDIFYAKRTYENPFRTKMAGVQRLLSIIGYEIDEIDGVPDEKTVNALNQIGTSNDLFGFDFDRLFPVLEKTIAQKQKLDG